MCVETRNKGGDRGDSLTRAEFSADGSNEAHHCEPAVDNLGSTAESHNLEERGIEVRN